MTTFSVQRRGPASKYEIWARYRHPQRWSEWAPHIREVRADGPLRPGLEGEVVGPMGITVRFEVLAVDEGAGRWTWVVRSGPIRLWIEHEIADGRAGLALSGPAPAVAAYAPIARAALANLVAARARP